jgi:hypothetical protein
VDRVCTAFEIAWREGRRPRIEDYLADLIEPERSTILHELILLERDYCRARGEQCPVEAYQSRFPGLDPALFAETLEAESKRGMAPTAESGSDVGRYRLVKFHAQGGLGEVHVAQDSELGRSVALKRMQDRHAGNEPLQRRFVAEAELTARLEHPGIVPVYGLVQDAAGQPCYAMRFIEGQSLKDAIAAFHSPDPIGDAGERGLALRGLLGHFVAVCNTLAFAHDRGIVHRDLKPTNIMLGSYGETFVVDWGLAKQTGATTRGEEGPTAPSAELSTPSQGNALTAAGTVLGTPAYMSPEQATGNAANIGPASDIYSLGAVLYELLTGRAPFVGSEPTEMVARVQEGRFVRPRQVDPATPRALEAVCLKAMAPKPSDRYGSAVELKAEVENWLADEPVQAYAEPWTTRAGRWARRHRAGVTAAAAVLVLATLGGAAGSLWYATHRADTERRMEVSLGRAEELRDQAAGKAVDDAASGQAALALWQQALAAAVQAQDIRAAGWRDSRPRSGPRA